MKKIMMSIVLLAMIIIGSTVACGHSTKNNNIASGRTSDKPDTIITTRMEIADSSKYGYVSLNLELPTGKDAAAVAIYNDLYQKLVKGLGQELMYMDVEDSISTYTGAKDMRNMCRYYVKAARKYWDTSLKQDNDETAQYIMNDSTMSAKEKKDALANIRQYGFDVKLNKTTENSRYVVFYEEVYGYTGGAHGGLYGIGAITYNRKTGKELRKIIKPAMTNAMQPLLKRGLKQYFHETDETQPKTNTMTDRQLYDALSLESKVIPLPKVYNVYPTKDGIVFIYGQYEIACYAAGMPTFTVPYSQIKPYLTDEAKQILGLR